MAPGRPHWAQGGELGAGRCVALSLLCPISKGGGYPSLFLNLVSTWLVGFYSQVDFLHVWLMIWGRQRRSK